MVLSIKDPEADRLARELAQATGETITVAVKTALRERLARARQRRKSDPALIEDLTRIALRCAALPELDPRSADEIIGYNEHGHFD